MEADNSFEVCFKPETTNFSVKHDPKTKANRLKVQDRDDSQKLELTKHRYNIRALLQYSNATPIRTHYVGSGFICCFCKAHFPKAADLKTHTLQDHDDKTKSKFMQRTRLFSLTVKLDITSLSCVICSTPADTLEQLVDHLNTIHNKGLHTDIKSHMACFKFEGEEMKCHICSIVFNSFKYLQAHMNKHFSNFICDVCGVGFINRSQLLIHSDIHKEGTHKCDTCVKVFASANKLKSHQRLTHISASEKYKCYHCGEKFKNRNIKKNHMIVAHGSEYADLKCDACDKSFKSSKCLYDHKRKDHMMKRYPCGICDSVFYRADRLTRHNLRHIGVRLFKCDFCSKSYTRKCHLKEHLRTHSLQNHEELRRR